MDEPWVLILLTREVLYEGSCPDLPGLGSRPSAGIPSLETLELGKLSSWLGYHGMSVPAARL